MAAAVVTIRSYGFDMAQIDRISSGGTRERRTVHVHQLGDVVARMSGYEPTTVRDLRAG